MDIRKLGSDTSRPEGTLSARDAERVREALRKADGREQSARTGADRFDAANAERIDQAVGRVREFTERRATDVRRRADDLRTRGDDDRAIRRAARRILERLHGDDFADVLGAEDRPVRRAERDGAEDVARPEREERRDRDEIRYDD